MSKTTVEITTGLRTSRRPVMATLGIVFAILCVWYGFPIFALALAILIAFDLWKYR